MFGAIAGGIASALAGGAMSKLFGGGQKAASGGIQGDVLATDNNTVGIDRKSGSAGMPRPISYAVFCLKKKNNLRLGGFLTSKTCTLFITSSLRWLMCSSSQR